MTTYKIVKTCFALTCLLAMTEACSLHCPQTAPRVCGSDGRTYDDECHLKISNGFTWDCRVPNGVHVVHEGPCDGHPDTCAVSNSGKECIFPFTYFGVTYNGCVEDSSNPGLRWCSTKVDSDGNHVLRQNEFGYCAANCPNHTGRRFAKLPPRPI